MNKFRYKEYILILPISYGCGTGLPAKEHVTSGRRQARGMYRSVKPTSYAQVALFGGAQGKQQLGEGQIQQSPVSANSLIPSSQRPLEPRAVSKRLNSNWKMFSGRFA